MRYALMNIPRTKHHYYNNRKRCAAMIMMDLGLFVMLKVSRHSEITLHAFSVWLKTPPNLSEQSMLEASDAQKSFLSNGMQEVSN